MARPKDETMQQLQALAHEPAAQAAFAATLLTPRYGRSVHQAALAVLERHPHPPAREALHRLYQRLNARQGAADPGTYLRAAIVRALRPMATPADRSLLQQAVTTYEFPPPAFKEEAAMLRSAALLALQELDDPTVPYHAVRLLADEYTDPMSGEPALTAVRLLAAHEAYQPLYYYVTQPASHCLPEVTSECLRHLVELPEELLPGLVERYAGATEEVVLVGLFDLLLQHRTGPHHVDFLMDYLQQGAHLDACRYLAVCLVASGREELLSRLLVLAPWVQEPARVDLLLEALALIPTHPGVAAVVERLEQRQRGR
ncbi:hypothetical protein FKZ61_012900 [Litorilinea aerophila]|uniref:HEAT repeat domain-containing protein n=1 Tax=Litorilinea aerophila TaxID=1204385 RepID=A0A540VEU3_9CHLR|nr:hypothetical protein [Litorilinea aerophila]MCC9077002.1 hypothetical protein [Litorilinea aerophila]